MRQTSARQLLDGWEALRAEPMAVRAASLAALLTRRPLEEVVRWSITRRDRVLFDLRAQMFGNRVEAVTNCPSCAEPLEMEFALADIAPPRRAHLKSLFRAVRIGGERVSCREPNTEDLLAVAPLQDVAEARARLLARCIRTEDPELRERAAAVFGRELPDDVQLKLTCPACAHGWLAPFDIAAFVWRELDGWAQRTLREIHVIASAYGWTEHEILELSARRRQLYVEMN
jgi:hypothetical protein